MSWPSEQKRAKVDEQIRAAVATGDTTWLRNPDGDYWGYGLEQIASSIENVRKEDA